MFDWLINEAQAASRMAAQSIGADTTAGDIAVVGWPGLVIGMAVGMAVLSVSYGLALYYVLRERFLAWHAVRNMLLVVMTVTIWPVPLGTSEAFSYGSDLRFNIGVTSFIMAVSLQTLFLRDFIEPDLLTPRLRKAIIWSAVGFSLCCILLFLPISPSAKMLFMVPAGLTCSIVEARLFASAFKSGNRSVRFVLFSIAPITLLVAFCTVRWLLYGTTGGYVLLLGACALMFEIFATAVGISERFFGLRMQRDRALEGQMLAEQDAITDPLTNLLNRRGLAQHFATRRAHIKAIAIVDFDHFKRLNDDFGHDVGDEVLKAGARALAHPHALAARLGGEEFVLLFETERAERIAEEIRQNITRRVVAEVPRLPLRVTASIGFMRIGETVELSEALKAADIALYSAKAGGRDRTMFSPHEDFNITRIASKGMLDNA